VKRGKDSTRGELPANSETGIGGLLGKSSPRLILSSLLRETGTLSAPHYLSIVHREAYTRVYTSCYTHREAYTRVYTPPTYTPREAYTRVYTPIYTPREAYNPVYIPPYTHPERHITRVYTLYTHPGRHITRNNPIHPGRHIIRDIPLLLPVSLLGDTCGPTGLNLS